MTKNEQRLLPDDPVASFDDYVAAGGGRALEMAQDTDPDEIIARVRDSGLRGRGGGGFPTGMKWQSVREAGREDPDSTVYVVVNGAEGEPGTYKDRALMRANPFPVIEGALIAQYAVGAEQVFVGVKKRYETETRRLVEAIAAMAAEGWPGAADIEVVGGPDEYLFGEEKALLEVIEGKLPLPRLVPPYQVGLFASMQEPNPTVVNNVETLANVPAIIERGADWFREVGTDESPGTMLFTVTGDVETAGVFELPLGTRLRTIIEGVAGASDVKAVFGGVALPVITPDVLDVPTGFDIMSDAGIGLGSAGYVVYDSSHCIVRIMASLSHFLAIESCGQCNACVLGTANLTDILEKIDRGDGVDSDLEALLEGAAKVTDLNRCYLPVGEQLMIGSTLEYYADEYGAHLGTSCWSEREATVPKIEDLDETTGEATYDQTYHLKQPDWTYADA